MPVAPVPRVLSGFKRMIRMAAGQVLACQPAKSINSMPSPPVQSFTNLDGQSPRLPCFQAHEAFTLLGSQAHEAPGSQAPRLRSPRLPGS